MVRFYHLLNFLQFFSIIVSIALSNFHLLYFKFIENFFTISLKLKVILLRIPVGICGYLQMPARMPVDHGTCENDTPMCTVAFTAVSYKRPHRKRLSEGICARFWTLLSGEALTSIPHLLRVVNLFLRRFTDATEINQMGPLLPCKIDRE